MYSMNFRDTHLAFFLLHYYYYTLNYNMFKFSNFPALIINSILKYTIEDKPDIDSTKSNLPYLAICQQWRYLSLQLVYKTLYVTKIDLSNNISEPLKMTTNIDLLTSEDSAQAVKKLYIFVPMDIEYHQVMGPLLDTLRLKSSTDQTEIVQNLSKQFPNITHISVHIATNPNEVSEFTSELVKTYFNQLRGLNCLTGAPLDIPEFPPNLTELYYSNYQYMPVSTPLPKINPLTIKHLSVEGISSKLSWQKYCNSLELSKLETLNIAVSQYTQKDITLDEPLVMPKLKELNVSNVGEQEFSMSFNFIPQHINVKYHTNLKTLDNLSKLPVASTNSLEVQLIDRIDDLQMFYQATNRIFGTIQATEKSVFRMGGARFELDHEKTNWKYLNKLVIDTLSSTLLVKLLAKQRTLEAVVILNLHCNDGTTDIGGYKELKESNIKELHIKYIQPGPSREHSAQYLFELLKCLQKLEKVKVYKAIAERLMELVKPLPQLRNIKFN